MKLEINCSAPIFEQQDVFGRMINLNEFRGKKVLICFFRHAGCPFCNLRVHMLARAHQELQAMGLEMIFFFESQERIILQSTFHRDVKPIPIISDPDKKWYDAYGIESSAYKSTYSHITSFLQTMIKAKMKGLPVHPMAGGESINTIPAEFLLDQNLIIRKLHYSETLNDRIAVDEIRAFVKS